MGILCVADVLRDKVQYLQGQQEYEGDELMFLLQFLLLLLLTKG